jgi:DNA-binding IclR family transcriptional regulator
MQDLYEATHEAVLLGIQDGLEVLYLETIFGSKMPLVGTRIGTRTPLYCTALGKALLAFSPPGLVQDALNRKLVRYAPRTITSPNVLIHELGEVARSCVAFEREEYSREVSSVAAPVLDREHHPLAALSIVGPSTRFDPNRYGPTIRNAANAVSRNLYF